jgi:hypothetical protein
MIQCHTNQDETARLVSYIYHPENIYFIYVDKAVKVNNRLLSGCSRENVIVVNDFAIVWGGVSLVIATIDAIKRALARPEQWRYFINLSGADLPLMPQNKIVDTLATLAKSNVTSFLATFENTELTDKQLDILERPSTGEYVDFSFRDDFKLLVDSALTAFFTNLDSSPIRQPMLRSKIFVREDKDKKILYVRPLSGVEKLERNSSFHEFPFRYGRQWCVFSKDLCEFIANSKEASDILENITNTFIPDESYFQIVANQYVSQGRTDVNIQNNLRYHYGEPCNLTDDMLGELQDSGMIFARKLAYGENRRLLDWAESMRFHEHESADE